MQRPSRLIATHKSHNHLQTVQSQSVPVQTDRNQMSMLQFLAPTSNATAATASGSAAGAGGSGGGVSSAAAAKPPAPTPSPAPLQQRIAPVAAAAAGASSSGGLGGVKRSSSGGGGGAAGGGSEQWLADVTVREAAVSNVRLSGGGIGNAAATPKAPALAGRPQQQRQPPVEGAEEFGFVEEGECDPSRLPRRPVPTAAAAAAAASGGGAGSGAKQPLAGATAATQPPGDGGSILSPATVGESPALKRSKVYHEWCAEEDDGEF
jgi:hypothetical protein